MVGFSADATRRGFTDEAPIRAYHGSDDVSALEAGMPAASTNRLHVRTNWRSHDDWMSGGPHLEEGIPYANIVWEALGLRDRTRDPAGVAGWARHLRSHDQLAADYGMLFVTNDVEDAERYGKAREVDLSDEAVIDVIADPHVRTHSGWIVILRTGARVPFVEGRPEMSDDRRSTATNRLVGATGCPISATRS